MQEQDGFTLTPEVMQSDAVDLQEPTNGRVFAFGARADTNTRMASPPMSRATTRRGCRSVTKTSLEYKITLGRGASLGLGRTPLGHTHYAEMEASDRLINPQACRFSVGSWTRDADTGRHVRSEVGP